MLLSRTMPEEKELSYRKILVLWVPLAATWLMMAAEGPFLAAVIARVTDPEFNLAAYGVAFSFAIIIEAPIIMILSASTALVKDRDSFCKLRNFTYLLNGILTTLMVVIVVTPAFDLIALRLMRLPGPVARLTYLTLVLLLPWPAAIGYRRFYQGLFIRYDMSRRVAYGTTVRLFAMASVALLLFAFFEMDGALVGAAALSAGVTAEAVASRLMVGGIVRRILDTAGPERKEERLTYRQIAHFYIPLALTSAISLAVQPMVTLFLGRSRLALESLVVYPVITSLVFIFRSVGLSYQEVGIALWGEEGRNYHRLRRFATAIGIISTCGMALIAFTPMNTVWFHTVSGLSLELSKFAQLPVRILTPIPALEVLLSFQRAILVNARRTRFITWTSMIEVAGIAVALSLFIRGFEMAGMVAAATALVLGRLAGNLYLLPHCSKVLEGVRV